LKINNNYKIDLSSTYGVSTSLNIVDLSPYFDEGLNINSRASSIQPEVDDANEDIEQAFFKNKKILNKNSFVIAFFRKKITFLYKKNIITFKSFASICYNF